MYIRYVLFTLLVFLVSFSSGSNTYARILHSAANTSAISNEEQSVAEKKNGARLDIEQHTVAQVVSQAQALGNHFNFKEQARYFLLAHFLSYLNASSFTAFSAVSLERNDFHHLSPRLLIFPKHWFW